MAGMQRSSSPRDDFESKKMLDLYLERGTILRENMKHINELRSSAFQLANYYFVFQGVILAAFTSGTTALGYQDRWLLVGLSALPALLNLCAFTLIGIYYIKAVSDHEVYMAYYNQLYQQIYEPQFQTPRSAAAASARPPQGPFPAVVDPNHSIEIDEDPLKKCARKVLLCFCVLIFVFFLGFTLYGCFKIPGRNYYH